MRQFGLSDLMPSYLKCLFKENDHSFNDGVKEKKQVYVDLCLEVCEPNSVKRCMIIVYGFTPEYGVMISQRRQFHNGDFGKHMLMVYVQTFMINI